MKTLVVTAAATVATASGAFAQGSVNFSDAPLLSVGVQVGVPGQAANWYVGTYSIELWELNGTTAPTLPPANPYSALTTDGFTLIKGFYGLTMTAGNPGVFALGEVDYGGVTPKGGSATFAIAAWNSAYNTWVAAVSGQDVAFRGGVVDFVNPTGDYTKTPTPDIPPDLTGWDATGNSLIMSVPEPTTFALAGLGAAALLIFRRRK